MGLYHTWTHLTKIPKTRGSLRSNKREMTNPLWPHNHTNSNLNVRGAQKTVE